jgi:glyoxylase-like metal-dependent hydrolase (beta-lactamase superfamily II)/8-oxo-dGTP pyrophosphatase MutT (NUDIX family)
MAFAAGMHVFPGGRVDAADASPGLVERSTLGSAAAAERIGGDVDPTAALAAHVAAIRELWEEGGILLADTTADTGTVAEARAALVDGSTDFATIAGSLDLRLRTDLLVPLSRWVTPPGYPRRFDARFFGAVAPDGGAVSIVGDEVAAIDWHVPGEALGAMAEGRIGLWLPTSATLQQLEHLAVPADLARLAGGRLGPVEVDQPAPDVVRIVMPAGGGVAGQPVTAYLVGRTRLVLVDPGDPTGPALERCLEEASRRGAAITAIALTHVDPDHHAGAEALAERLDIPVFAGPGASRRLPYPIRELADGDVLEVGDIALRVVATPGPRPDHVALLVGSDGPVLTGDLDGVRGSRSVVGPVDEAARRASLARLATLAADRSRLAGHPGAPSPNGP